ncbi:DUF2617 family protein [Mariniblastus fucicola]|uniref:DUF2617 domain-containing protein n=1 Tax=Mariniblastus fucicola TaxID=980251 RepID=A0A5B9PEG8_9BACT|nr:DUF2617 family protein [Mariniblastus fucicola]QEG24634.1 hypothetical protein MFFC18_45550 [Mariniblastus fucicola]
MNFHLFAKPVHPELVEVCGSRHVERDNYRLQLNITTDGHLITFQHNDLVFCEVAAAASHELPKQQRLVSHAVGGSMTNGPSVYEQIIGYQSNVSMDSVDPKIFVTIQQQLDKRVETDGLVHRFQSNGRLNFGAISYMHAQSFISHIRVRAFHTFPETCAVLKTDTVFRVGKE